VLVLRLAVLKTHDLLLLLLLLFLPGPAPPKLAREVQQQQPLTVRRARILQE
jgi:hypothetical protein